MSWTKGLVLLLLNAAASVSAECHGPGCAGRSGIEEDTVSLLQVSAAESTSRRSSVAKHEGGSLAERRAKLVSNIHSTRAYLAMMETDLKEMDESLSREKAAAHHHTSLSQKSAAAHHHDKVVKKAQVQAQQQQKRTEEISKPAVKAQVHLDDPELSEKALDAADAEAQEYLNSDYALISTNSSIMKIPKPQEETPRWNSLSLLQLGSVGARALLSSRSNDASAGGVWVGSVLYKYGVTQAFSEGAGCREVPGIETVDGPAGLPDYLAYFAYQVEKEPDNKQIEKVSKAFGELLPNSGSWHTIKIALDTQGNQCMLQDKMHFSPANKMCHIGLVWSGDSGREFWIVSHNPHGDGVKQAVSVMQTGSEAAAAQEWQDW